MFIMSEECHLFGMIFRWGITKTLVVFLDFEIWTWRQLCIIERYWKIHSWSVDTENENKQWRNRIISHWTEMIFLFSFDISIFQVLFWIMYYITIWNRCLCFDICKLDISKTFTSIISKIWHRYTSIYFRNPSLTPN